MVVVVTDVSLTRWNVRAWYSADVFSCVMEERGQGWARQWHDRVVLMGVVSRGRANSCDNQVMALTRPVL